MSEIPGPVSAHYEALIADGQVKDDAAQRFADFQSPFVYEAP